MKETEHFYKTKQWQSVRDLIYKRAAGLCEECYKQGKIRKGDIVHHIEHINPINITDRNIAYNPENLILLCRECHGKAHKKNIGRYTIGNNGDVLIK